MSKQKIGLRELHRMNACEDGREQFAMFFPKGAELTFETALKIVNNIPDQYIEWFLEVTVGYNQALRYKDICNRADERAINNIHQSHVWDKRDRHVARWLYNLLSKNWDAVENRSKRR